MQKSVPTKPGSQGKGAPLEEPDRPAYGQLQDLAGQGETVSPVTPECWGTAVRAPVRLACPFARLGYQDSAASSVTTVTGEPDDHHPNQVSRSSMGEGASSASRALDSTPRRASPPSRAPGAPVVVIGDRHRARCAPVEGWNLASCPLRTL